MNGIDKIICPRCCLFRNPHEHYISRAHSKKNELCEVAELKRGALKVVVFKAYSTEAEAESKRPPGNKIPRVVNDSRLYPLVVLTAPLEARPLRLYITIFPSRSIRSTARDGVPRATNRLIGPDTYLGSFHVAE